MNITPEIVKNLLDTLVTPNYPELIDDYMVDIRTLSDPASHKWSRMEKGWTLISVGVIVHPEVYHKMDTYTGNPLSGIDRKIRKEIKAVLKYLGPSVADINLYVVDDE